MRGWWLFGLGLAGCKDLKSLGDLRELLPKVRFDDVKVDDLTFEKVDGKMLLDLENPYPVELRLTEASWKLGLAGQPFLDGTDRDGLAVDAAATSKLRIPFAVRFVDAFRVASSLGDTDRLPFALDADLGFDTPVGPVRVPFHHEGNLPALHAPQVRLGALRVGNVDLMKQKARLELDLRLHSDQPSALSFDTFRWNVKLVGADVAGGNAEIGPVVGDKLVTLPIDVDLLGVGEAVVGAITRKGPMRVRLTADADIGTPFGSVPLAIDEAADLDP